MSFLTPALAAQLAATVESAGPSAQVTSYALWLGPWKEPVGVPNDQPNIKLLLSPLTWNGATVETVLPDVSGTDDFQVILLEERLANTEKSPRLLHRFGPSDVKSKVPDAFTFPVETVAATPPVVQYATVPDTVTFWVADGVAWSGGEKLTVPANASQVIDAAVASTPVAAPARDTGRPRIPIADRQANAPTANLLAPCTERGSIVVLPFHEGMSTNWNYGTRDRCPWLSEWARPEAARGSPHPRSVIRSSFRYEWGRQCSEDPSDGGVPVKFRKAAAAVSLVTAGLLLAACSSNSSSSTTTGPPTTAATASKSIVQIAASNPEFSTLVAAIKAAGLTDTLSGPGPYTVFAPTNAAFAALPAGTLTTLLEPQNKPELVKILTYHVVTGALMAKDIKPGTVSTAEGSTFTVHSTDGALTITDGKGGTAKIVKTDIVASNGVIHVIDAVLQPAT